MDWLLEQPLLIVLAGGAALGLLAFLWVQTGKQALAYALAAGAVVLIALLVAERLTLTDGEAIRATLQSIARDVAANQRERLYAHIASTNPQLRQKAEAELPSYDFQECAITHIHRLDVHKSSEPRTAEVEFTVRIAGNFRYQGETITGGPYLRLVTLQMRKESDGRWTVHDYSHADPQSAWLEQK